MAVHDIGSWRRASAQATPPLLAGDKRLKTARSVSSDYGKCSQQTELASPLLDHGKHPV